MGKADVVPFGKYKGQPVEVLANDHDYCQWLMAQEWFRDRYRPIYTIIVNNFGEPADTPEHNQLQALFIDQNYCQRFIMRVAELPIAEEFTRRKKRHLAELRYDLQAFQKQLHEGREAARTGQAWWARIDDSYSPIKYPSEEYDAKCRKLENSIQPLEAAITETECLTVSISKVHAEFELEGADVVLNYGFPIYNGHWRDDYGIYVELKPSVGDDYPAILRQMMATRERLSGIIASVLFIGDGGYTGTGATLEQVQAIFLSRKVHIVLLKDLNL